MNNREMPALPNTAPKSSDSEFVIKKDEDVPAPAPKKKGIEVVALRAGFYKQSRKVEGDKFEVPDMSRVGSWMQCLDPVLEKQHQASMKAKKSEAGK